MVVEYTSGWLMFHISQLDMNHVCNLQSVADRLNQLLCRDNNLHYHSIHRYSTFTSLDRGLGALPENQLFCSPASVIS